MTTLDELKKIVARVAHCNVDGVSLETPLKDIDADSLHWVQIILAAEETYNIEIDLDKMTEITTVGELVNYIQSLAR